MLRRREDDELYFARSYLSACPCTRYETTFRKEVLSDLYGERGILMGAIQGAFAAQYEVLRAKVRYDGTVVISAGPLAAMNPVPC